MIKLEKAIKRAFITVPDKIRLFVVIFPCMDAIKRTTADARMAPIKAPVPVMDLSPKIMLSVAPNVAPAEIPKI